MQGCKANVTAVSLPEQSEGWILVRCSVQPKDPKSIEGRYPALLHLRDLK